MKKLLFLLLFPLLSFGQLIIDQSIVEPGPYTVGQIITIKYTVERGSSTPRYFWLRYQYSNKHLEYVANSTVFSQGSSSQTFYTGWSNYSFNQNPQIGVGELYNQYKSTPWGYQSNMDWNVGQLTVQRTDAPIDGVIATQKYKILDNTVYTNIHKFDLSYAVNADGTYVDPIGSRVLWMGVPGTVTGQTSSFKVRVSFPSSHTNIVEQKVQIMPLTSAGVIDWTNASQPLAIQNLNAQGEATFTNFKVGDKFGVVIVPAFQKPFLNDIVTVSDAYKAFLAISDVGLTGNSTTFAYPALQKIVGNVTRGDGNFDNNDAYYLFAHVMGINVDTNASIPSSTATSLGFISGKKADWANGNVGNYAVEITSQQQAEDFAYAYRGDLDFSHSSDPSVTSSTTGKLGTLSYTAKVQANAVMSLASKLENGKVVINATLSDSDLSGVQVVLKYDTDKLTLDDVKFDTGNTVTNFSTNKDGRVTFGSIDQTKTGKVRAGIPYKITFTPKSTLTNTSGLFYTVLADAVKPDGTKVNLTVE
jgi:hypothetical protein